LVVSIFLAGELPHRVMQARRDAPRTPTRVMARRSPLVIVTAPDDRHTIIDRRARIAARSPTVSAPRTIMLRRVLDG